MRFVGVFVEDTEAKAREFMKAYATTFPNGYDWALEEARPLGFRGMPYTVIISAQGEVAQKRFDGAPLRPPGRVSSSSDPGPALCRGRRADACKNPPYRAL